MIWVRESGLVGTTQNTSSNTLTKENNTMTQLAIHGGLPACTTPWPKWPLWDEREKERLLTVLESGEWGGFNPMLKEFEATFASRHQAKHCLTLVNGTLSLEAALRAVGVEHGDEVIVPPYTFIATANAVRLIGAIPVFVDVEPGTYNLDISRIEEALSPRTKAVIPVHFAGLMADMDALLPLAKAAQSRHHRRRSPRPRQHLARATGRNAWLHRLL